MLLTPVIINPFVNTDITIDAPNIYKIAKIRQFTHSIQDQGSVDFFTNPAKCINNNTPVNIIA